MFFGWLTDRLGRKKLFFITLAVYLAATAATALSWDFASFALFRFLTGAGIGGEYTAINSTIQELMPARVRGWTDLAINGSFWVGAALGALGSLVLLDPALLDPESAGGSPSASARRWRSSIFFMRLWLPESPRWLMTHGRADEAERGRRRHRARVRAWPTVARHWSCRACACARARTRRSSRWCDTLVHRHRPRTLVGLALMTAQAFFYNAIFFTYALVLTDFYGVPAERRRLVHPALRGRQFPRAAAARPAVRHASAAGR